MKPGSREQVLALYRALNEKQAQEISIIDISGVSTLADYFMIMHGKNTPHVDSLVDMAEQTMAKLGIPCRSYEGLRGGRWVLLDYSDVVVHIFSREERLWYDLERIWRDGKAVTAAELEAEEKNAPEPQQ